MPRLFAALVCLLVVSSCASPARPAAAEAPWRTDTELVTIIAFDPDTIDPQKASFDTEKSVAGMLYEPLLTWDPATLTLMPAAARALPEVSSDGRVYTYFLRSGLTYSDGSPLLARRFVDAFLRLCDPRVAGELAFTAYPIAGCAQWSAMDPKRAAAADLEAARERVGVRAPDDLTVEFTLHDPLAAFPQTTALTVGSPVRQEDADRWMDDGRTVREPSRYVGNGPFVMTEWRARDRLVFERNERFRLPVRLAKWTRRIVSDADTARVMYDAGRIDAYAVSPRDAADRESLLARTDIHRSLGACTTYVGFNTALPPFDDANVRLAFAKALDKEDYARGVLRAGRAAFSLIPHAQPGHAHDDRVQAFDAVEARRLLASSKYGAPVNGVIAGIPLSFAISDSPRVREQVEWIVGQWLANLGVAVVPRVQQSWGSLVKRPEAQPQLYRLGWCEDYPDGQDWYSTVFKSTSLAQRTNWKDARFDELVTRADAERDPATREALYQEASRVLSAAAPGAWLAWTEQWWLVDPRVSGYELSSFDWGFAQLSLARIVGVPRRD